MKICHGKYEEYKCRDSKKYKSLMQMCVKNSIFYYEKFLESYNNNDKYCKMFNINEKYILEKLADKYMNINEKEVALKYYKINFNKTKSIHSIKKISQIESNGNKKEELKILYKYCKNDLDLLKKDELKKYIIYIETDIKLKEKVYEMMKEGIKQVDIIKQLKITQSKIRTILLELKEEGKVVKLNNKYTIVK